MPATKARKTRTASADNQKQDLPPPPTITGRDIKRVATCAAGDNFRWDICFVEISPTGLAATDGRLLCVLNAPGWPYQCYIAPADLKPVQNEATLSINGAVEFAQQGMGGAAVRVPHKNPDEVYFPKWRQVLPDAANLQPIATFSIAHLKKLISALQRTPESVVTLCARTDDCSGPALFGNEAGDLGILMPITGNGGEEAVCHFPAAVYAALGLDAQTLPVCIIPKIKAAPPSNDGEGTPVASGLLGAS